MRHLKGAIAYSNPNPSNAIIKGHEYSTPHSQDFLPKQQLGKLVPKVFVASRFE